MATKKKKKKPAPKKTAKKKPTKSAKKPLPRKKEPAKGSREAKMLKDWNGGMDTTEFAKKYGYVNAHSAATTVSRLRSEGYRFDNRPSGIIPKKKMDAVDRLILKLRKKGLTQPQMVTTLNRDHKKEVQAALKGHGGSAKKITRRNVESRIEWMRKNKKLK